MKSERLKSFGSNKQRLGRRNPRINQISQMGQRGRNKVRNHWEIWIRRRKWRRRREWETTALGRESPGSDPEERRSPRHLPWFTSSHCQGTPYRGRRTAGASGKERDWGGQGSKRCEKWWDGGADVLRGNSWQRKERKAEPRQSLGPFTEGASMTSQLKGPTQYDVVVCERA